MADNQFGSYFITDGHVHYAHPDLMPGLMTILDAHHISRLNVVCTPHRTRLSLVPDALHLKAHYPDRVYVYGGMDISPLFMLPDEAGGIFADYVDTLINLGCDGIKMIEGKPDMRRMLPIPPFDGVVYAPYWERLADRGVPLVFHVNDPEEFWDARRIPAWARQQGWFYGDGGYINNEEQYSQVINVLERHPGLKVIFAHFFFLSAQLPRLAGYLDRFPGMHVDLTPGIEMYANFARNPQAAHDFFIKYQDRIVYGSDIGARSLLDETHPRIDEDESAIRIQVVRQFLETETEFQLDPGGFLFGDKATKYHGIALPPEVLEKIYHLNFERLAGKQPRPLNPSAIASECERLAMMVTAMGAAQPGSAGDASMALQIKDYFERSNG